MSKYRRMSQTESAPESEDEFFDSVEEQIVLGPNPSWQNERDHFSPQYTLSQQQLGIVEQFRHNIRDLDDDLAIEYCSTPCLVRYLRARNWKLAPAEELLRDTVAWRQSYGVKALTPDDFAGEAASGKIYVHGNDRFGRPVIYQRPRRENTKDYLNQVKYVVYTLERAVSSMECSKGVEQHTMIIDFKGYSMLNAPPFSVTKEVLGILMNRFPERMGASLMVDAPTLFHMTYRLVKPFMSAETKAKVHFVKRSGKHGKRGRMDKVMARYFDDDMLEEEYGGTLTSNFDHDAWLVNERRVWKELQEAASSSVPPAAREAASSGSTEPPFLEMAEDADQMPHINVTAASPEGNVTRPVYTPSERETTPTAPPPAEKKKKRFGSLFRRSRKTKEPSGKADVRKLVSRRHGSLHRKGGPGDLPPPSSQLTL